MNSTSSMEIGLGASNDAGAGSGTGGFFRRWNPSSPGDSPNEKGGTMRPGYIGLAHELAHVANMWAGNFDTNTWFSVTDPNGNTANVRNHEIYATHTENKIRTEFGLPLRTHYTPGPYGIPYEPSRIIKRNTAESLCFDSDGNTNYSRLPKTSTPYR